MAEIEYTIEIGDEEITFIGPDGLTDEQIEDLADKHLKKARPGQKFKHAAYVGPKEEEAAPAQDSSALGSFLRALPKDATFNFGDEIASAVNAVIPGLAELDNLTGAAGDEQQGPLNSDLSFWDRMRANMGDFKAQAQADEEQHPLATGTGRIAGALSTLPRAGTAIATRLPEAFAAKIAARPVTSAVGLGAAGGAASGAGAGEEGTRAQSAALGGFLGAGLGGAVVGGMELAPAVANYAKIFFNKASDSEAIQQIVKALHRDGFDVITPSGVLKLKETLQSYLGKPVSLADIGGATRARAGVGLRAPSEAQQESIEAVRSRQAGQGQRIAQDIRANVAPRTDVHALDEALVAQRAEEATKLRDRALFEDVETPTMYRGGAEFNPNHPGPTFFTPDKEAAETYLTMHKDRFGSEGVLQETPVNIRNPAPMNVVTEEAKRLGLETNLAPASIFDPVLQGRGGAEKVQALMTNLKRRGYDGTVLDDVPFGPRSSGSDAPMQTHIPFDLKTQVGAGSRQSRIIEDPELQQLARLPDAQKALGAALERARSERDLLAATGQDISHLPDLDRGSNLDVRTFDYLKRFLDDEVNALYKRGDTATFKAGQAGQVRALRDAIRERLRTAVPEYGEYLDAYRGSSEMIDSLAAGRNFDNLDPEQIAAEQAGRSVAGQELYRVGAARNLLDAVRETRDTGNAASRILNSDESRAQLAATGVLPEAAENLNRSVAQERRLNLLPQELAGSQTAQRAMAQADANAGADLAVPFNPGSPLGWYGMIGRTILNRTSVNRNAAVNERVLPRLLETDPAKVEVIIKELEQEGNIAAAKVLRRQLRERQAAAIGGAAIGSSVAVPSLGEY